MLTISRSTFAAIFALLPLAAQHQTVVTKSRSNVKDNLVISNGTACSTVSTTTDASGNFTGSTSTTGPCAIPASEWSFSTFLPPTPAPVVTFIPQVVDQVGLWRTRIAITNTTATAGTANLSCYQDTAAGNGTTQPWTPSFVQNVNPQSLSLGPAGTLFLDTTGTSPTLAQGWCMLTATSGIQAYALFSLTTNKSQGIAPAVITGSDTLVPVDNANGSLTAFAVVNPNATPEIITVVFQNTNGAVAPMTITLPALGHNAFLLPSLIASSAGQSGLAELTSTGSFSLITLQFNSTLNFTSGQTYTPDIGIGPLIGAIDPSRCEQNPALAGCPTPTYSVLMANVAISGPAGSIGTLAVNITPGGNGTYTAAVSGTMNGQSVTGAFTSGTLAVTPTGVAYSFSTPAAGSTFSSGSLTLVTAPTSFDPGNTTAGGNVTGQISFSLNGVAIAGSVGGQYRSAKAIAKGGQQGF